MNARQLAAFVGAWMVAGLVLSALFGVTPRSEFMCVEQGSTWGRGGPGCAQYADPEPARSIFNEDEAPLIVLP